jgi:bifunctional UDP-N-acetylglucosamine pyrophosphorylase/glucosamine-1-phosphate N-acetyltransferase
MQVSVIILAAGQGTRMNSDLPKVLHQVAAAPLLHHALATAHSLDPSRIVVVTGHGGEAVAASATAFQRGRRNRRAGPAAWHRPCRRPGRPPSGRVEPGEAIVLYADTPLIREETLRKMLAARARHAVVILGFHARDPGRYGRLDRRGGTFCAIREFKDATRSRTRDTLCNSGVVCAEPARSSPWSPRSRTTTRRANTT